MNALLHLVQIVVVPAVVRDPGEEPVAAVVSQQHPEVLERPQDDLIGGREPVDVDVGLEPEALPHRRRILIGGRTGLVACRPDVCLLGQRGREAEGMGG